jgi:hypothetical protein
LFPSMQTEFSADCFKPHYRYENMSDTQIQFFLIMIPINKAMNDIFLVLSQTVWIMKNVRKHSGEEFNYNIDRRIKLAVIYNNFRDIFPNLYWNLNRYSSKQNLFLIFDTYLNDKGNKVYYILYFCDLKAKQIFIFEQTDSSAIGREVTKNWKWNEEIDLNFVKNTQKQNLDSVTKYFDKFRDMEKDILFILGKKKKLK